MLNRVLLLVFLAVFGLACQRQEEAALVPTPPSPAQEAVQLTPLGQAVPASPLVQQEPQTPAQMSPMAAIKDLDRLVDQYKTSSNLSETDLAFNRDMKKKILRGTFDVAELAELALDIHWNEINLTQQDDFVDLLQNLLEKKAIFSKEQTKTQGKSYSIAYNKEEYLDPEKTTVRVETKILIPKDDIDLALDYKLHLKGGVWKIFDVIVDGASLVENYKYQFHTIIAKNGYEDLIGRMKKKLAEFETKV